jgi:hypothetical protein
LPNSDETSRRKVSTRHRPVSSPQLFGVAIDAKLHAVDKDGFQTERSRRGPRTTCALQRCSPKLGIAGLIGLTRNRLFFDPQTPTPGLPCDHRLADVCGCHGCIGAHSHNIANIQTSFYKAVARSAEYLSRSRHKSITQRISYRRSARAF